MARPLWSGTIQISLVGFAVEIYPATSTTRPFTFHEIDRNTLGRVRRASVAAGPASSAPDTEPEASEEIAADSATNVSRLHLAPQAKAREETEVSPQEPMQHSVDRADIVKGYEYEQGKYAIVEPDELKNLRLAGKKTIEIAQFAKASEINPALYEKPYFVMPKPGPQAIAFSVMRQSMTASGMVGVGEIVFSGRQHLMTLAPPHDPHQPGMMLYTLRFATELRDARDLRDGAEGIQGDVAQLQLAKQLVDAYARPFAIEEFKDHYEEALRELVEAKIKNLPPPQPEVEKKSPKAVDLMEALRLSLSQLKPTGTVTQSETVGGTASGRGSKTGAKEQAAGKATRGGGKKARTA